jgi:hypothetical protein
VRAAGLGRVGGVHRQARCGQRKYSLYAPSWDYDWAPVESDFVARFGAHAELAVKGNHAVFACEQTDSAVRQWIKEPFPALHVLSAGRSIDIYKTSATPPLFAKRYQFKRSRRYASWSDTRAWRPNRQ